MTRFISICIAFVLLFAGWSRPLSSTRENSPKGEETTFDCVLELLQSTNKGESRVGTLIKLAEVYAKAGKRDKALQLMNQAQKEAEAEKDHPTRRSMRTPDQDDLPNTMVNGYLQIGAFDFAMEFARKIVKPSDRASRLARIASEMAATGDKEKANGLLVEILKTIKISDEETRVLAGISSAYAKLGNCEQARRIALAMSDKWPHIKAPALARIACECAKNGSRKSAAQLVSESIRVVGLMNDETLVEGKYEVLAHAASAQIDLGKKERALRMLAQALAGARKTEFNMIAMEAIADAYANARLYEKAKEVANSIDYRPSRARALLKIARRHLSAGDNAVAIGLLDQSLKIILDERQSTPTLRFESLADIALEYKNASRADRASEVLVESLRELRREDEYVIDELLLIVFSGYARLKQTPDETARQLIGKLCSRQAFELTPEEVAKQHRVEEAADRFIERWQQTLDMNVLFDELYVSNPKQRQLNARMFYGVYKFLSTSAGPAVDIDIDDALMRDGFFIFWNRWYLVLEYQLAYRTDDQRLVQPPEFKDQPLYSNSPELDGKRMSRRPVEQYIDKTKAALAVYRKYLTPEVFKSQRYRENIIRDEESSRTSQKRFKIVLGFPEFGVPNDVEVYYLRKGVFEFYFVEENGKLKVLTLGFEL